MSRPASAVPSPEADHSPKPPTKAPTTLRPFPTNDIRSVRELLTNRSQNNTGDRSYDPARKEFEQFQKTRLIGGYPCASRNRFACGSGDKPNDQATGADATPKHGPHELGLDLAISDTEAGTKSCIPGRRRRTSGGGTFINLMPENTSESCGDRNEDREEETPSRQNGNGKRPAKDPESLEPVTPGKEKRFACPNYKNDPRIHKDCSGWSCPKDLHRVKEHVLRKHLRPCQCPRCGHRTGEPGQLLSHLEKTDCPKIPRERIERVEPSVIRKSKSMKSRKSWKQVYILLFECNKKDVPSPYIDNSETVSYESGDNEAGGNSSSEAESNEPESPRQRRPDARGFATFLSERLTDTVEQLFTEYQGGEASNIADTRKKQHSEGRQDAMGSNGADSAVAEYRAATASPGRTVAAVIEQSSVAQASNVLEPAISPAAQLDVLPSGREQVINRSGSSVTNVEFQPNQLLASNGGAPENVDAIPSSRGGQFTLFSDPPSIPLIPPIPEYYPRDVPIISDSQFYPPYRAEHYFYDRGPFEPPHVPIPYEYDHYFTEEAWAAEPLVALPTHLPAFNAADTNGMLPHAVDDNLQFAPIWGHNIPQPLHPGNEARFVSEDNINDQEQLPVQTSECHWCSTCPIRTLQRHPASVLPRFRGLPRKYISCTAGEVLYIILGLLEAMLRHWLYVPNDPRSKANWRMGNFLRLFVSL
ncbi:hypothetical protein K440DRAFT_657277, partial [Wilcoxina mikolae CBS 423.85]